MKLDEEERGRWILAVVLAAIVGWIGATVAMILLAKFFHDILIFWF